MKFSAATQEVYDDNEGFIWYWFVCLSDDSDIFFEGKAKNGVEAQFEAERAAKIYKVSVEPQVIEWEFEL